MSHPAIFTPRELRLRRSIAFRRWYLRNADKQRQKAASSIETIGRCRAPEVKAGASVINRAWDSCADAGIDAIQ